VAGGVETFRQPSTSNTHRRGAGPDRETRCVLGLFEGVVTGAADGYARMAEKPACTLLHLGPGLSNGLANLHNASRAQVPLINLVGTCDRPPALQHTATSDIEHCAALLEVGAHISGIFGIGRDAAEAVVAARTAPGQIATLIVPPMSRGVRAARSHPFQRCLSLLYRKLRL